jgi:autotransporter-associated beta strand protein
LDKTGTGTLVLDNNNDYQAGTTIDLGTLMVGDGTHTTAVILGDVQVNPSGTLAGHGTVTGNVANNGTVQPGGSIGTLTVLGNYSQTSTGKLALEVSPTSGSLLSVNGNALLNGKLDVLADAGKYSLRTSYIILDTSGSVSGAFSSLTTSAGSGLLPTASYGAKAVTLDLTVANASRPWRATATPATWRRSSTRR